MKLFETISLAYMIKDLLIFLDDTRLSLLLKPRYDIDNFEEIGISTLVKHNKDKKNIFYIGNNNLIYGNSMNIDFNLYGLDYHLYIEFEEKDKLKVKKIVTSTTDEKYMDREEIDLNEFYDTLKAFYNELSIQLERLMDC